MPPRKKKISSSYEDALAELQQNLAEKNISLLVYYGYPEQLIPEVAAKLVLTEPDINPIQRSGIARSDCSLNTNELEISSLSISMSGE